MRDAQEAVQGRGDSFNAVVWRRGIPSRPVDRQGSASGSCGDLHDVQPHHAARLQDPRGPLANGWAAPVAPVPQRSCLLPAWLLPSPLGDWMWWNVVDGIWNYDEVSYAAYSHPFLDTTR